jgi:two-component system NtrC family sensor kinase
MYTGLYQRLTNQGALRLVAACGSWFPVEILDEENDLLGRIVMGGVPIRVHQGGPGNSEYQNFLNKFQLGSLICVPVEQKEGSSLLIAARQESEPVFREADQEMLLILSRQSAAALENARLYAELRSYVKQVEKSRAAMLQTEKLVAAGRLTASIAHEINNPLQSLSNCLHLTSRKELSPEDRQKYLTMAQIELDRLMTIVQRMLDFYRPGARDRKLHDINEIVKRVLSLLEPQLLKGNITVRCNLEPDLPLIFVMSSQIQQVLLNLFINSMEAMPGGGEMVIETMLIKPDDFSMADGPGERAIVITISDNGPGIPESEREQLFEPFVSTKETGTGLGLAVSYGIIAAHGGTIDLVDVTKGACFRIILPEDKQQ